MSVEMEEPTRKTAGHSEKPMGSMPAGSAGPNIPRRRTRAEDSLSAVGIPSAELPRSSQGEDMFRAKVLEFEEDLHQVSQSVADRRGRDTVDELDVRMASELLTTGPIGSGAHLWGTLGGALVGAALSTVLNMVIQSEFTAV